MSNWQDCKDQSFCKEDQHALMAYEQSLSPEHHALVKKLLMIKIFVFNIFLFFYRTPGNRAFGGKKKKILKFCSFFFSLPLGHGRIKYHWPVK